MAKAVQSNRPLPSPKHETASSRNSIEKWYIIWGLDSLRHTFRDRLRAVQCPIDLIDQIGGWKSVGSIGNSYGKGYSFEKVKAGIC